MIFKVFFRVAKKPFECDMRYCRVFAVENGQQLETRIDNTISNLKADGYVEAHVEDCWNISEPTKPLN